MTAHVASLHVYPIKSCRAVDLDSVDVAVRGFAYDREWMVIDANGRFLSQRQWPEMARIVPALTSDGLVLSTDGQDDLVVPYDTSTQKEIDVSIWNDQLPARYCGHEAATWLSAALNCSARLVRFDKSRQRQCSAQYSSGPNAHTMFADGFPFLLLAQASVQDLAKRMNLDTLPIDRFRANIVVAGLPAYEEDMAVHIQVGETRFKAVKLCPRCEMPGVDQQLGKRVGPDPIETLLSYRFRADIEGAPLGHNLIVADGLGSTIRVGDSVGIDYFPDDDK